MKNHNGWTNIIQRVVTSCRKPFYVMLKPFELYHFITLCFFIIDRIKHWLHLTQLDKKQPRKHSRLPAVVSIANIIFKGCGSNKCCRWCRKRWVGSYNHWHCERLFVVKRVTWQSARCLGEEQQTWAGAVVVYVAVTVCVVVVSGGGGPSQCNINNEYQSSDWSM